MSDIPRRELQVGVFLPAIAVFSGGVERMVKIMEYSRNVNVHCTVYLEPGLIRNPEMDARVQDLAERGIVSVTRKEEHGANAPHDYDGILIPSEFWQRAWTRAKAARARGAPFIEFQQLPYVGTLDVLRTNGHTEIGPLDLLEFPFAASRVLGDALPFSAFRLAGCVASVRHANLLRDGRIMATTTVVRRHLEALGFSRETYVPRVPLGIEAAPLRDARTRAEGPAYDAVFVGRFHPHKGFLDLPALALHLKRLGGDGFRIAVCGAASSPRYLRQYQNLVTAYGVGKNLVMLGRLSREDLYRTIRRSPVLLYPSYVDSFSLTVLESLILGTPVLAYSIDALRWIWKERKGVYLSPVGDPRAMAEAYLRLRRETPSGNLENDLSSQSERLLNEYTWEATVQDERRFLEGLPSPVRGEVGAEVPLGLPG